MSCKDCGGPIDEHMAKLRARLSAKFEPGQPIKMPTRCTGCAWKAIERLSTDGPPGPKPDGDDRG